MSSQDEKLRKFGALAWTIILLQPITLLGFVPLAKSNIWNPFLWVYSCFMGVVNPYTWSYMLILSIFWVIAISQRSKHYSVSPAVLSSRLSLVWNLIQPRHLFLILGHVMTGAVSAWSFSSLLGDRYSSLTQTCREETGSEEESKYCINEHHAILVLHGIVTGLVSGLQFLIYRQGYLQFPAIQQPKFFQVKLCIMPSLTSAFHQSLRQIFYFCVIYYLIIGTLVKQYLCSTLGVSANEIGLDSLAGLLDLSLLLHLMLSSVMIIFVFSLSSSIFKAYLTQPMEFQIESDLEEDKKNALPGIMSSDKDKFLQFHAYQDLWLLCQHSPRRRQVIFSLSQPGGHPHSWTAVSGQCLAMLNMMNSAIRNANESIMTGVPTSTIASDKQQPNIVNISATFSDSMYSSGADLSYRKPTVQAENIHQMPQAVPPASPTLKTKIWEHLKKRKAIAFFVSDLPDASNKRLFQDCQIHIWAVNTLGCLAQSSFKYDSYGVVQKSLPSIISTLLYLQEAVEKHLKLCPPSAINSNRKSGRASKLDPNISLRLALRSALKSALYKVVLTFDKHLSALDVSHDHQRRLQQFATFKE